MKIPNKVKIGYAEYSIEDWSGLEASREARYGDYDHERLTIRIGDGVADPVRATVLLHEICHGIVQHFNVPCGEQEEEIVTSMAEGLAQVITDNHGLVAWLEAALAAKPEVKKK